MLAGIPGDGGLNELSDPELASLPSSDDSDHESLPIAPRSVATGISCEYAAESPLWKAGFCARGVFGGGRDDEPERSFAGGNEDDAGRGVVAGGNTEAAGREVVAGGSDDGFDRGGGSSIGGVGAGGRDDEPGRVFAGGSDDELARAAFGAGEPVWRDGSSSISSIITGATDGADDRPGFGSGPDEPVWRDGASSISSLAGGGTGGAAARGGIS